MISFLLHSIKSRNKILTGSAISFANRNIIQIKKEEILAFDELVL